VLVKIRCVYCLIMWYQLKLVVLVLLYEVNVNINVNRKFLALLKQPKLQQSPRERSTEI